MSKPDAPLNLALTGLARRPFPTNRPTFEAGGGLDVEPARLTPDAVRSAFQSGMVSANRFTCRLDAARASRFLASETKRTVLINLVDADSSAFLQIFWAMRHVEVLQALAESMQEALHASVRFILPADLPSAWRRTFEGVRTRLIDPRYPVAHHRLLPRAAHHFARGAVLVLDAVAAADLAFASIHRRPISRRPVAVTDANREQYRVVERGTDIRSLTDAAAGDWFAGPLLRDQHVAVPIADDGELIFHREASGGRFASACIRCGGCIEICPTRCDPVALLDAANEDDATLARRAGLASCIECGLCTAVCPASIELHHVFIALGLRIGGVE